MYLTDVEVDALWDQMDQTIGSATLNNNRVIKLTQATVIDALHIVAAILAKQIGLDKSILFTAEDIPDWLDLMKISKTFASNRLLVACAYASYRDILSPKKNTPGLKGDQAVWSALLFTTGDILCDHNILPWPKTYNFESVQNFLIVAAFDLYPFEPDLRMRDEP